MHRLTLAASLLLIAGSVCAKTPDGRTPAEERVCDPLRGGTPGLYGLCVSYCEARDLDDIAVGGLSAAKAEKVAARKQSVLAKYDAKKKPSDPDMPCVTKNVCPCWSSEYTSASFWLGKNTQGYCLDVDRPDLKLNELGSGIDFKHPEYANIRSFGFEQGGGKFANYCARMDAATGVSMFQAVSETDANVCATQVRATCGVLGY